MLFSFYFYKNISSKEIKKLLSGIFNINPNCFVSMAGKRPGFFYRIKHFKKGFNTFIEFSISESIAKESGLFFEKELAILFANSLKTSVLISSQEINPYQWILIDTKGKEHIVDQINIQDSDTVEINYPVV